MATTFNMFDLIFVIASFIFILVAFFRGFVKELFALLNWIITICLSCLLAPYAAKFVETYSSNKLIINVASGSMVFIIVFILIFLATRGLSHDWKEKMPENLDRILGVFYGVFKSLLIFGLFYSITINFYSILLGDVVKAEAEAEQKPKHHLELTKNHELKKAESKIQPVSKKHTSRESEKDLPEWLTQARCFSIVKFAGETINPLISKAIDSAAKNLLDETKPVKINLDNKIDEVIDDGEKGVGDEVGGSAGVLSEPKSSKKESEPSEKKSKSLEVAPDQKDKGYSKKEIEKMNRLIEIVN